MKIKVGDYLVTEENQLFRIIDMYTYYTDTYYDIKPVNLGNTNNSDNLNIQSWYTAELARIIKAVPHNVLKHMGKVISEEKAKTLKILYGKTLT